MAPAPTPTDVVRGAFAARTRRDFDALAQRFAPDARWRAVQDGPWNCESRDAIIEVMRRNTADAGSRDAIAGIEEVGERVVVAFRPDPDREVDAGKLDDGLVYVVVSLRDGLIVELKACADRPAALAYAQSPA
jgi:ketosteroid isomerase-like protein